MIRSAWFGVLAGALMVAAPAVQAVSIGLDPVGPTISVGDTVEVSIEVSGLGNGVVPSLGGFDLTINFDPGILTFQGFVFGDPVLGNQLDLFSLGVNTQDVTTGVGTVSLFELSFDLASDLETLQAADFALGVLTFRGTGVGVSGLEFEFALVNLSDQNGDPLDYLSVVDASVAVEGAALPEPGTLLLMAPAALALTALRRRRERSSARAA